MLGFLERHRSSGPMRILARIHPPEGIRKILDCLGLRSRAQPIARAAPEESDAPELFCVLSASVRDAGDRPLVFSSHQRGESKWPVWTWIKISSGLQSGDRNAKAATSSLMSSGKWPVITSQPWA